MVEPAYPLTFSVEYPDRPLNRLTSAFRIFVAIPALLMLTLLSGTGDRAWIGSHTAGVASGGVALRLAPVAAMLLFRRTYPGWWFEWNREFTRYFNRIGVYLLLMDDRYPSTEDHQAVRLDFERPDAARLN